MDIDSYATDERGKGVGAGHASSSLSPYKNGNPFKMKNKSDAPVQA